MTGPLDARDRAARTRGTQLLPTSAALGPILITRSDAVKLSATASELCKRGIGPLSVRGALVARAAELGKDGHTLPVLRLHAVEGQIALCRLPLGGDLCEVPLEDLLDRTPTAEEWRALEARACRAQLQGWGLRLTREEVHDTSLRLGRLSLCAAALAAGATQARLSKLLSAACASQQYWALHGPMWRWRKPSARSVVERASATAASTAAAAAKAAEAAARGAKAEAPPPPPPCGVVRLCRVDPAAGLAPPPPGWRLATILQPAGTRPAVLGRALPYGGTGAGGGDKPQAAGSGRGGDGIGRGSSGGAGRQTAAGPGQMRPAGAPQPANQPELPPPQQPPQQQQDGSRAAPMPGAPAQGAGPSARTRPVRAAGAGLPARGRSTSPQRPGIKQEDRRSRSHSRSPGAGRRRHSGREPFSTRGWSRSRSRSPVGGRGRNRGRSRSVSRSPSRGRGTGTGKGLFGTRTQSRSPVRFNSNGNGLFGSHKRSRSPNRSSRVGTDSANANANALVLHKQPAAPQVADDAGGGAAGRRRGAGGGWWQQQPQQRLVAPKGSLTAEERAWADAVYDKVTQVSASGPVKWAKIRDYLPPANGGKGVGITKYLMRFAEYWTTGVKGGNDALTLTAVKPRPARQQVANPHAAHPEGMGFVGTAEWA